MTISGSQDTVLGAGALAKAIARIRGKQTTSSRQTQASESDSPEDPAGPAPEGPRREVRAGKPTAAPRSALRESIARIAGLSGATAGTGARALENLRARTAVRATEASNTIEPAPAYAIDRIETDRANQPARPETANRHAPPAAIERISGIRQVIGERLQASKQQAPHYYMSIDCRAEALESWRQVINASLHSGEQGVSLNDCIIKAVATTLSAQPALNAAYLEGQIHRYKQCDIAFAVSLDGGLITPVVRDAANLGVKQIAMQSRRLIAAARDRRLTAADYEGGSFTISNLGMYGVRDFSAIINPPQIAILAVAAIRDVPVVDASAKDGLQAGRVISLGLSVDHRAADGLAGALFLSKLRSFVEEPRRMLL